ncbi:hypothetical protein [Leadbetterella sp. DM7]|uniref:hypothetical protein n=1 Tax=Leadbetterella sp. DM7 TaxID=3235085 RepID=UPI00349E8AA4
MGNDKNPGVKKVYSELLSKNKLDVEIFDSPALSGVWKTKFDDALVEFNALTNHGDIRLSNSEVMKLKMYKLNKEWAEHIKNEGYTILDMGDFNNLGFSVFYSMEKATIFK